MNGDPLDSLFDDLRQPGTASELAAEDDAVAAITASRLSKKGTTMRTPSNVRHLRVASVIAAGIIGFGSVAAAGPAIVDTLGSEPPTDDETVETSLPPDTTVEPATTVETTEPTTTTIAPETTVSAEPTEADTLIPAPDAERDVSAGTLVDDPETAFDETTCAAGNHGKTVSSVAQATPSGPGKGQIVSAAAQSSCGKQATAESGDDQDEIEAADAGDGDGDEPPGERPSQSKADDVKNGNGKGNGNGKASKGKSPDD